MTEVAALQRGEEASTGASLPARLRQLLPGGRNRAEGKTGGKKRGPFWKRIRPATLVVLALLVGASMEIGRASCREKSVSVRVDLGVRRTLKQKKTDRSKVQIQYTLKTKRI